jgi:hypothetical protein
MKKYLLMLLVPILVPKVVAQVPATPAAPTPFVVAPADKVCTADYECEVVDLGCCQTGDAKDLAAVSKFKVSGVLAESKRACRAAVSVLAATKKAALEAQKKAVTAASLLELDTQSKLELCKGQTRALFAPRAQTTCAANVCTIK